MLDQLELDTDNLKHRNPTLIKSTLPSLKSKVCYQDPDADEWKKGLIVTQAGKKREKINVGVT